MWELHEYKYKSIQVPMLKNFPYKKEHLTLYISICNEKILIYCFQLIFFNIGSAK